MDIVRAVDKRIHVLQPQNWGTSAGTDFWANWGNLDIIPTGPEDLEDHGWIASGFTQLAGTIAGLLDPADVGTTGGINFDSVSDYIISPFIFGDFAHAKMVEAILGYVPTTISFECYARFAAGNDEEETGFGFLEAGVNDDALVKGDEMAFISVDGTDFSLESGAAVAVGSTKDTTPHLFKVTGTLGGSFAWSIDGTAQANSLAIQDNLSPFAWGAGTKASTGANDPVISWLHIWYE